MPTPMPVFNPTSSHTSSYISSSAFGSVSHFMQAQGGPGMPYPINGTGNGLANSHGIMPTSNDRCRPPHPIVCFGFGGRMAVMFPKPITRLNRLSNGDSAQSPLSPTPAELLDGSGSPMKKGSIKLFSLSELIASSRYYRTLAQFPGPLLKKGNQENVTAYVGEKARDAEQLSIQLGLTRNADDNSIYEGDRILWEIMAILVKHFAVISAGRQSAYSTAATGGGPFGEIFSLLRIESESSQDGWVNGDKAYPNIFIRSSYTEEETQRAGAEFQRLLLCGERRDAVRVATENGLWADAMLLASHMDNDTYKDVVTKFAQVSFATGSPLKSLYYLFASQAPELFKPILDNTAEHGPYKTTGGLLERWKENLAMALSNPTSDSQKFILQLGDLLWMKRSMVSAAHVCYLLANQNVESTETQGARLVLIGGNHHLANSRLPSAASFVSGTRTWITLESIQLTEIYEFARRGVNKQFFLPQLLPFKLLYAMQLADIGKTADAKSYIDSISELMKNLSKNSNSILTNPFFAGHFEDFSRRINSHLSSFPSSKGGTGSSAGGVTQALTGGLKGLFGLVDKGLSSVLGSAAAPIANATLATTSIAASSSASNLLAGDIPKPVHTRSQSTGGYPGTQPSANFAGQQSWTAAPDRPPYSLSANNTPQPLHSDIPANDYPYTAGSSYANQPMAGVTNVTAAAAEAVKARSSAWVSGLVGGLKKALSVASDATGAKTAETAETEKGFYYDKVKGVWVVEGQETEAEEDSKPPPAPLAPPPVSETVAPPTQFQYARTSVRSRYVDTLNPGATATFSNGIPPQS
eukprot:GILK01002637.1.p1 GENE.GILK01002637.1~~GILK01002637.1.p1  ORF type:complete len:926 (-),score=140.97 GILK01002637.1:2004-4433(-)